MNKMISYSWPLVVLIASVANSQQPNTAFPQSIGTEQTQVGTEGMADVVPAQELEAALQELEQTHASNYNTLAALAETVPASAQPAIKRAMENSRNGWARAREKRAAAQSKRRAKMAMRQRSGNGRPEFGGPGGRNASGRPEQMRAGNAEQFGRASAAQRENEQARFGQFQQPNRQPSQFGRQQGGPSQARQPSIAEQSRGSQSNRQEPRGNGRGRSKR